MKIAHDDTHSAVENVMNMQLGRLLAQADAQTATITVLRAEAAQKDARINVLSAALVSPASNGGCGLKPLGRTPTVRRQRFHPPVMAGVD